MSSSVNVANEVAVGCSEKSVQSQKNLSIGDLPMSVNKSKTVTAGPMRGNIKENVDANTMAKMQAPVANEGL